jgi:hypothetical protein
MLLDHSKYWYEANAAWTNQIGMQTKKLWISKVLSVGVKMKQIWIKPVSRIISKLKIEIWIYFINSEGHKGCGYKYDKA